MAQEIRGIAEFLLRCLRFPSSRPSFFPLSSSSLVPSHAKTKTKVQFCGHEGRRRRRRTLVFASLILSLHLAKKQSNLLNEQGRNRRRGQRRKGEANYVSSRQGREDSCYTKGEKSQVVRTTFRRRCKCNMEQFFRTERWRRCNYRGAAAISLFPVGGCGSVCARVESRGLFLGPHGKRAIGCVRGAFSPLPLFVGGGGGGYNFA